MMGGFVLGGYIGGTAGTSGYEDVDGPDWPNDPPDPSRPLGPRGPGVDIEPISEFQQAALATKNGKQLSVSW